MNKLLASFLLLLISFGVHAQLPLPLPGKPAQQAPKEDRLDSLLSLIRRNASRTRSYSSVITAEAGAHRGSFTLYEVRDSLFMEIPDTLYHRDLELINRLVKGSVTKSLLELAYPGEDLL